MRKFAYFRVDPLARVAAEVTSRGSFFRKPRYRFLAVYEPTIVFGTITSVTDSFQRGLLALKSDHIDTHQIDEASQLPTYAVIALGVWCPKAWFALIGDVQQLELQEIFVSLPSETSSKDRSDPLVRPFEITKGRLILLFFR